MDLLTILKIVFRRWYVTVPIVLIALLAAWQVQSGIAPMYEARGSVLLEEPRFDPSRSPTSLVNAETVVTMLETEGIIDEASRGETDMVSRARDLTTIEFAAAGRNAAAVSSSVDRVLELARDAVTELQTEQNIPEAEQLTGMVLTPAAVAEEQVAGNFIALGTLLLRDPSAGIENPYYAGGATTSVLQTVVSSDAGRVRVAERAPGIGFAVDSTRDAEAIINITTMGADAQAVIEGFGVVRDVLNEELDARQARADVAASRRIIVTNLAEPQSVSDVSPPLNRAVAAIIGLGGLLAIIVAVALESLLGRSRGNVLDESSEPTWFAEKATSTPWPADEDRTSATEPAGREAR